MIKIDGWQSWVYVYEDHVIKKLKTKAEFAEKAKNYLKSIGKIHELDERSSKVHSNIYSSIEIIKKSKIPQKLLCYPEFLEDGTIKQKRAVLLKDAILNSSEKEAKKLIDGYIELMKELWQYGIHETTFKYDVNFGILGKEVVLLDLFELTEKKSTVEKQLFKKPWDKPNRIKDIPQKLEDYFIEKANKEFTIENLNKYWNSKK